MPLLPRPIPRCCFHEGAKKADAGLTAGLCCIVDFGVWAWKSDGEPLRDWDHVELDGREVSLLTNAFSALSTGDAEAGPLGGRWLTTC